MVTEPHFISAQEMMPTKPSDRSTGEIGYFPSVLKPFSEQLGPEKMSR
jgi:hypothetical protein